MNTGTKSLLFGTHQFLLHPLFVIAAWRRLYGDWPDGPTLVAIFVHDWGYWGCEKMDDKKGEEHPIKGAKIVERLFPDRGLGELTRYHSRFLARREGARVSRMCLPDNYGVAMYPCRLSTKTPLTPLLPCFA